MRIKASIFQEVKDDTARRVFGTASGNWVED